MDGELICIKVLRVFMDNGIEERNKMIKVAYEFLAPRYLSL